MKVIVLPAGTRCVPFRVRKVDEWRTREGMTTTYRINDGGGTATFHSIDGGETRIEFPDDYEMLQTPNAGVLAITFTKAKQTG